VVSNGRLVADRKNPADPLGDVRQTASATYLISLIVARS